MPDRPGRLDVIRVHDLRLDPSGAAGLVRSGRAHEAYVGTGSLAEIRAGSLAHILAGSLARVRASLARVLAGSLAHILAGSLARVRIGSLAHIRLACVSGEVRMCLARAAPGRSLSRRGELQRRRNDQHLLPPGCAGRPNRANVRAFSLAAAAEAAGFRACLRCRPYRVQPAVSYHAAPELVCRAVRLVVDGALDEGTEHDLSARLGISARHLRRLFAEHLGVTPDHLARSTRVHFARRLLDDTDLPITDVTFAAGFGSVRQFNRACREVFRATPGDLRARRRVSDRLVADGGLALRLPFQPPFDWPSMAGYLRARSIAGVEHVTADCYRRTVVIDGDPGVLELSPGGPEHLVLHAHLPHWAGLIHVAQRARGIVNLDADVEAASRDLGGDPLVGRLFRDRPGVRPPGAWDPFETGVEAIVGEQAARPRRPGSCGGSWSVTAPRSPACARWG